MAGTVILSHGLNSSPEATKVSAMALVARGLGWQAVKPDFSDLDASGRLEDIDRRIARLHGHVEAALDAGPVVLGGSSMGAFCSGFSSLRHPVAGLFLIAPPVVIDGYPRELDAAPVPTTVVHGWADELIPARDVVRWTQARRARLILVDDGHRLERHVALCAEEFGRFLSAL